MRALPFTSPRSVDDVQRNVVDIDGRLGTFGEGELAWAGAVNFSDVLTVTHKLGVVPGFVFCQVYVPIGNTATRGFTVEADDATFTSTTFQVRGWCSAVQPVAGTVMKFAWHAVPTSP